MSKDLDILCDANNLYNGFKKTKKPSQWKKSVQAYEIDILDNLDKSIKELKSGTYKQDPFTSFELKDRGRTRYIKSMTIRDRTVLSALCDNVLIPRSYKFLNYDNGASVKGKGIGFTRKRFVAHIEQFYRKYGDGYILLMDW